MPEDNSTWDSASESSSEPAAPVAEIPVADPPAAPLAETPTLEKPEPAPLEVEAVSARESESPEAVVPERVKEEIKEDHEEGDAPEIQALPTPAAKKWARRQHQDAAPVRTFLDFEKPIKDFGDDLLKRSPSRYSEHVADVIASDRDFASKKLFGVSYDDAKTRLDANAQPTPTTKAAEPATLVSSVVMPTDAELEEMTYAEAIERFRQITASQQSAQEQELRKLESRYQSEVAQLKEQFDTVTGETKTAKDAAQQKEIDENQSKLLNNILSVVDEGIRNSGLEADPNDPPRIASLKRAAARLLDKPLIVAAFDTDPDNAKVAQYATEAIKRREYQNAFREEDNLKVRARAAFESVKQSPEVQAILGEIEAYANQSKANSRATNPVPPAPGSSLGVNIKSPTTWDEAERVSTAA